MFVIYDILKILNKKRSLTDSLNEWIKYKGVCRTARQQSGGPGTAPWLLGEPGSSTCFQPASVTRTEASKYSRTTWTSSCPGCQTSLHCQAWPGPRQPIVCWTTSKYYQINLLQTVVEPNLGWEPIAVLWGGLLHSSLTPTPSLHL